MEAHVVRFSLSMLKSNDNSPLKYQLTSISSIVEKNDCVVCLPTGHGKSCAVSFVDLKKCDSFPSIDIHLLSPSISSMYVPLFLLIPFVIFIAACAILEVT